MVAPGLRQNVHSLGKAARNVTGAYSAAPTAHASWHTCTSVTGRRFGQVQLPIKYHNPVGKSAVLVNIAKMKLWVLLFKR